MSLPSAVSPSSDDAHAPAAPARGAGRPARLNRSAFSLRWSITIGSIVLVAAAVLGVSMVQELGARRALGLEVEKRLIAEARNLAFASAAPLAADFPELALHPVLKEMKTAYPDLGLALVLDASGVIQGDADARRLGTRLENMARARPRRTTTVLGPEETLRTHEEMLVAAAPILRDGTRVGTAVVGTRLDFAARALEGGRAQHVTAIAAVVALGGLVTFLFVSLLLAPLAALRGGLERIGRGDLRSPLRVRGAAEFGGIADAANEMVGGLQRVHSEMLERERHHHEEELARRLQASLLPKQRIETGDFVVEGSQRAATEAGGDSYDFFELEDGAIGVAVADVAGKGLSGCLVLSMLTALLRAYRHTHRSPAELLAQLDARLGETLPAGSYVTMFYGVLDPHTGILTYASAGHEPLLVYRAASGSVERLKSSGIPLGAMRGGAIQRTLTDAIVELGTGDLVLQFTDGVQEAPDARREAFGLERMTRAIEGAARHGSSAVIAALHQAVEEWTGGRGSGDDETLLVVSRERQGAVSARKPGLKLVPRPATAARAGIARPAPPAGSLRTPGALSEVDAFATRTDPAAGPPERAAEPSPLAVGGSSTVAGGPVESIGRAERRAPAAAPPRLDVTAPPRLTPGAGGDAPLDLEFGPPRAWSGGAEAPPANALPAGTDEALEAEPPNPARFAAIEGVSQLEGLEHDRLAPSAPVPPREPAKPRAVPPLSLVPRDEIPAAAPPPPLPPPLTVRAEGPPPAPARPEALRPAPARAESQRPPARAEAPPPGPAAPQTNAASSPAPSASGPQPAHAEVLRVLEEARAQGRQLSLQATFQSLVSLRTWTAALYPPGTISDHRFQLLSTALYEACANIVEHGCALDPTKVFEVYWLPVGAVENETDWLDAGFLGATPGGARRGPVAAECRFVIRDHGIPFRADNWKATDFSDPEVWKRGRGFGMDIVHRVMKRVVYHPGTPEGNLTLMEFDSQEVRESGREQRHVR